MKIETPRDSAVVASILRELLPQDDPGETGARLQGVLANLVGPMPEAYWQDVVRIAAMPCPKPECDCHTVSGALFDRLDDLRTDWIASKERLRET